MIDLHTHLLPGVDDGAPDMETAIAMARLAVADGTRVLACTPHIVPGVYPNHGQAIRNAVSGFAEELNRQGIPLRLVHGADAHIRPDFISALRTGEIPTLNDSRYVLFEPTHDILPPRLDSLVFDILAAGYVPILTHPERLAWIEQHYDLIVRLARAGTLMQITAGSLTSVFGKRPQRWAERLLADGLVHLLASDAHNLARRRPAMADAVRICIDRLGAQGARHLVVTRPLAILEDRDPSSLPAPGAAKPARDNRDLAGRSRQKASHREVGSEDVVDRPLPRSPTGATVKPFCDNVSDQSGDPGAGSLPASHRRPLGSASSNKRRDRNIPGELWRWLLKKAGARPRRMQPVGPGAEASRDTGDANATRINDTKITGIRTQ